MIVAVQTVGRLEGSLPAAKGAGFLRHGGAELLHGTADMFGDGHGGVIVGLQHESVEQVGQEKLAAGRGAQMDLRGGGRIFRKCDDVIQVPVFQGVETGHDLGGAGHGKFLPLVFSKEHPLVRPVHQNGGFGRKIRRCFRCQRFYGMIRGQNQQKNQTEDCDIFFQEIPPL